MLRVDKRTVRNRRRPKDEVEKKGRKVENFKEKDSLRNPGKNWGKRAEEFKRTLQTAPWMHRSQLRYFPNN